MFPYSQSMLLGNRRRNRSIAWRRRSFITTRFCFLLATTTVSIVSNTRWIFSATTTLLQQQQVQALSTSSSSLTNKIAVIGGGASGIFASISAAEYASSLQPPPKRPKVVVLEATSNTLQKVKISGGGRCNVMHDTSKSIPTILSGYPRGQRELNGMYHKRFTPTMARKWFVSRGVELKVEDDGRMFPVTDSSQTIMDTLMDAANQAGVEIRLRQKVTEIEQQQHQSTTTSSTDEKNESRHFTVHYKDGSTEDFGAVILATGSSPAGYTLAKSLGHDPLISQVPSLFTLNCKHAVSEGGLLFGLSGVSVPLARVSVSIPSETKNVANEESNTSTKKKQRIKKGKALVQEGPLLITHHGISGPATLRLSAFGARELNGMNYRGQVTINWDIQALGSNAEHVLEELWKVTATNPKRAVSSVCPLTGNTIPRRLWSAIVIDSGFTPESTWGMASKKLVRQLATNLVAYPLEFTGKGTFKEEFVTAGGVDLKEIDMKTMESKICPGLYFCGELINVDGVTGGYNFMNCWSTGYVAGESSVEKLLETMKEQEGVGA